MTEKINREVDFETALTRLDKVVKNLEAGDLSLEEALALFEEGIKLAKYCNEKLADAETRMYTLLQMADGTIRQEPFCLPEESGV
jgi:exodeoxyribonuclease VII small subunit